MKTTKRIVSSALVLFILLAFCCTPIMAAEPAIHYRLTANVIRHIGRFPIPNSHD